MMEAEVYPDGLEQETVAARFLRFLRLIRALPSMAPRGVNLKVNPKPLNP